MRLESLKYLYDVMQATGILVWGMVQNDLGNLQAVIDKLLDQGEAA